MVIISYKPKKSKTMVRKIGLFIVLQALRMMFNDFCLYHVNNILCNISGVVAYALEKTRYQQKLDSAGGCCRILNHVVFNKFLMDQIA